MLLLLQKETQSSKMIDSKMNTHQDERMTNQWPPEQKTESGEIPLSNDRSPKALMKDMDP